MKIKGRKNKKYQQPGFSIIEILAVLFIISLAMLGVVSLIIQNIQVQSINKNQLMAASLAQEGIELVRQIRDTNWLNGRNFASGLDNGNYVTDFNQENLIPTDSTIDTRLYLDADGFYVLAGTGLEPTIFKRQIFIERLPATAEDLGEPLKVRSLVSWEVRDKPYRYELGTLLYDWR
jgi:prepilin-type N-terminal cleavage/methylation domain-containing protein